MRRLKKNYYIALFLGMVGVLGVVRWLCEPEVGHNSEGIESVDHTAQGDAQPESEPASAPSVQEKDVAKVKDTKEASEGKVAKPAQGSTATKPRKPHPIYSVPSFSRCFPDLQDTHIVSARKWGVSPVKNRKMAEQRKDELVFVGSNPYYKIDPGMSSSIPYLVPRAANVLETIARNYLDSLHIKGIPMHKILVSSVLRTEEDIEKLRKTNVNASPESCHRFGTTFDIPYNRYHTVAPPMETRRAVQNDTLKWVLAEVLRDVRESGLCYIKYEVKQGCFHITAR